LLWFDAIGARLARGEVSRLEHLENAF